MRGLTRIIFPIMAILAVHILTSAVTSKSIGFAGDFMRNETECTGSIAECSEASTAEFEMDSEINRRILQTTQKHISYDALQANTVPCSVPGNSYYGCKSAAQANPYNRGCSAIDRCQRG
ncbi:Protein RALF-like 33 [Cardamine amara subsp. amara]|uniref:Protein RALF-like 33 n=1 Tax=Cardamine amara subsp. amara TaxID=228776 RepID=A0ABD1BTL0_CARAN